MTEEPTNSNENQDQNDAVTIRALRSETRNVISVLLNPKKILNSEQGLPRYWLGLAELCGIGGEEIANLRENRDPSAAVLDLWCKKNPNTCTVDKLEKYLEDLDRFDVIDDVRHLIARDVEHYKECPEDYIPASLEIDDRDILIRGDVERKYRCEALKIYDAFVLFADEDVDFASELRQTMQNKPYDLDLCTREDLLGGCIELDAIIRCISNRCKRLVVVLSPDFFKSSANEFFCRFAQMEGIEQRKRKIIPCLCRPCANLPGDFRLYFLLDYERSRRLRLSDFWNQLYHSLVSTPVKKSLETSQLEPKAINHVKFNSMVNLNVESETIKADLADNETVDPSPNYDSLGPYTLKKRNSFYNTLKSRIQTKLGANSDGGEKTKVKSKAKPKEVPLANGAVKLTEETLANGCAEEEKPKKKRRPPKVWGFLKSHKVKVPVAN